MKMALVVFTSLDKHPGEALPLFAHDLKKRLVQTMLKLNEESREQLLLHQFMADIPVSIGGQFFTTGELKKLNDTVEHLQLLISLENDNTSHRDSANIGGSEAAKAVHRGTNRMVLTTQSPRPQQLLTTLPCCFFCKHLGHITQNETSL